MTEPDRVEEWRAELLEVEEAQQSDLLDDAEREALEARQAELEGLIAREQNPVGPVVAGEPVMGEVLVSPAPAEMVVHPDADVQSVFRVLDRHDEAAILEEVQRRALKVMAYDFKQGGQQVVDLSYQGVNEIVRLMNNTGKTKIRVDPRSRVVETEVVDDEVWVKATVFAEDRISGYGQFGTSSEPRYMRISEKQAAYRRKEGKPVRSLGGDPEQFGMFDSFAETKALNKAQRNALKTMIPEQMRQAMIAMVKKDATMLQTIHAGAGAVELASRPAPLDTPEAAALNLEIRMAYDAIREVDVTALLPGQYHAKLAAAQHDVTLLESLRDALRAQLNHLKGRA